MSETTRLERIEHALREALDPTTLRIRDDGHLHVGHAGARSGRGHFHVTLRSEALRGLTAVARHRAVYAALGTLMETDIHAVSLDLGTPEQPG